ncbi:hypothetical protein AAKU61_003882 [Undibacterium sp. GrIS 1.2]|uniref:hypothetical protein n=1 Tax=Undibacterium sp. GrIS 1.2 TaxID=3143933 RepID=UPI0033952D97
MNKYHLDSKNIFTEFFVKQQKFDEMSIDITNRITKILILVEEEQIALKLTENMSNVTDISHRKWQVSILQFATDINKLSELTQKLHFQYLMDAKVCILSGNKKLNYLRRLISNYETELSTDLKERAMKSLSDYQTLLNQIDRLMTITAGNVANIMSISSSINDLVATN